MHESDAAWGGDPGRAGGVARPDAAPRSSRRLVMGGFAAAAVGAAWTAPVILTVPAAAAASGCVALSGNLIDCPGGASLDSGCFTGDPDEDPNPPAIAGSPPMLDDPPWSVTNGLRVCDYGHTDMPTSGDLSPPSAAVGSYLFCGSFSGGLSPATAVQTIDVASFAGSIDAGAVTYELEGYLGGNPAVATTAELTAEFKNLAMTTLATATLGPQDSTALSATGLVLHNAAGPVPTGTRWVVITLSFSYPGVSAPPRNTAAADLLSLQFC